MLRLFITRHGETVWNTQKKLQGWKDSDLTEKGIKNALSLGNRLKDIEFQSIYSSPSKRTLMTAKLILGDRKQPILKDDNLREMNLGDWEGLTHDFLQKNDPEDYHAFWNTPHLYIPKSGEGFYQLLERVKDIFRRIVSENDNGNILVVTHTISIKALLSYCKKLPLENLWSPPFIHDTSLTIIEIKDGNIEIILEGDAAHRNDEKKDRYSIQ
ncbi:histidine phosphatase family protein [Bacillus sp. 03113]|uniref:histidine phosphatase family protein n=1 Tax=Bacillus sp. 03113 TaxID=2578211 RepID=UPI0011441B10|nr:histidine phosphatase family protein [Bacillus sp. 03113]